MAKSPTDKTLRDSQNFLHNTTLVQKIVNLAYIPSASTILEIGAGEGIITRQLAKTVGEDGHVIALELDQRLADKLRRQWHDIPQIEIINADILKFDLNTLGEYHAFANVPFNITSQLLEYLFQPQHAPINAHLILQRDTLLGTDKRGHSTETLKSLMIAPFYEISVAHSFKRTDYTPPPSVDTALFAFIKRPSPLIKASDYTLYKDFLAYVSKDRVGEGVWKRAFSKKQLSRLTTQTDLIVGRGLKAQSMSAIIDTFHVFLTLNQSKHHIVKGAMGKLREEQNRREQLNHIGGHHRSRQHTGKPKRR